MMNLDHVKNKLSFEKHSPDFEKLFNKLNLHHRAVVKSFHATHGHAKKLLKKHGVLLENLRHAGAKATAGAAVAGSLFISPAYSQHANNTQHLTAQIPKPPMAVVGPVNPSPQKMTQDQFASAIKEIMGSNYGKEGNLSDIQLQKIKILVKQQFNVDVDSKTANGFTPFENYGWSGREQWLPTHPGTSATEFLGFDPMALASGVTPGRGAWGYVPSNDGNKENEYYTVIQTFRSSDFGTSSSKNLAGQRFITIQIPEADYGNHTSAVIGGLWDAGPGVSTGKVFGHSPRYYHDDIFGPRAGQSARAHVIMLPVLNDVPTSKLGPLEFSK